MRSSRLCPIRSGARCSNNSPEAMPRSASSPGRMASAFRPSRDTFASSRGPRKYSTVVEKMDLRPGGTWRFVQHDAEGNEYGFHGEYREVVPLERIVETFEFEGMPGHVLVESAVFEEIRGKTKVTQKSVFATVEDLEGMLASGMEEGARETIERFAELVEAPKESGARPKKEQARGRAQKNGL